VRNDRGQRLVRREVNLKARREECVETLDEVTMALEEVGDALNDARCVDTVAKKKKKEKLSTQEDEQAASRNRPLRLEVFHDVEELIVNFGLVVELDLDLVEVRQGVLDIERANGVRRNRNWTLATADPANTVHYNVFFFFLIIVPLLRQRDRVGSPWELLLLLLLRNQGTWLLASRRE